MKPEDGLATRKRWLVTGTAGFIEPNTVAAMLRPDLDSSSTTTPANMAITWRRLQAEMRCRTKSNWARCADRPLHPDESSCRRDRHVERTVGSQGHRRPTASAALPTPRAARPMETPLARRKPSTAPESLYRPMRRGGLPMQGISRSSYRLRSLPRRNALFQGRRCAAGSRGTLRGGHVPVGSHGAALRSVDYRSVIDRQPVSNQSMINDDGRISWDSCFVTNAMPAIVRRTLLFLRVSYSIHNLVIGQQAMLVELFSEIIDGLDANGSDISSRYAIWAAVGATLVARKRTARRQQRNWGTGMRSPRLWTRKYLRDRPTRQTLTE
jgi:hypothetical protein